jgi:hypothetical protein
MNTLNFIGGEKGGVGKSVVSRVLAQYFIDNNRLFMGFDTDRSHSSFTRFYGDFASPVIVDTYEGLDVIASVFEEAVEKGHEQNVIVDLAAQTGMPLTRWIKDSDLFSVMAEMGVTINFWHVADVGKDSVELLGRLINTFEPQLQEASMCKIDRQNASFWAALNNRADPDSLGLLERQRVKHWLKKTYETFDTLPL